MIKSSTTGAQFILVAAGSVLAGAAGALVVLAIVRHYFPVMVGML